MAKPELDDEIEVESKTRAKAASHASQALGERLAELPLSTLKTFNLPERLFDAFEVLTRTRGHEGLRRQKQYIGKLMRLEDPAPIEAKLAFLFQSTNDAKAQFKRCETWRDNLLADPNKLDAFCAAFPNAKREVLQRLLGEAANEKAQNKPPKHARLLFRAVTSIITEPQKNDE
jgi:ribosome-associated protein